MKTFNYLTGKEIKTETFTGKVETQWQGNGSNNYVTTREVRLYRKGIPGKNITRWSKQRWY